MKRLAAVLALLIVSIACASAQEPAEAKKEPGIGWKWANFVILAAGLGYLLAKNLPPFFRSRTAAIQKGIAEAQEMKRDAEKRAAQMDARMNALGAEIEKFRTQAGAEMHEEGSRIRRETAKNIEKLQQQAQEEIESASKRARRELKTYAGELALDLAEQRIRTRLDAATETALVEGFVNDLQRQGAKN